MNALDHAPTVTRLHVENFMRVQSIDLTPSESGVIELHGANAQGKSSLLRAMWAALGGKAESPSDPVRKGTESATAVVELGDLVVTRKWRADGSTTLTVATAAGAKFSSPQEILNNLISRIAFDPVAFMRYDNKKQAQVLREVAGVDTSAAERAVSEAFDKRREQNALVRSLSGRLGDEPECPEAIDVTEASNALVEIAKVRAALDENHRMVAIAEGLIAKEKRNIANLHQEIESLQRQLERADTRHDEAQDDLESKQAITHKLTALVEEFADENELRERIAAADANNQQREQHQRWSLDSLNLKGEREIADQLTAELDARRAEVTALVTQAKYPIDGLSVSSDGVTFNGIPLDQASQAEQLRVSMAMAMATNPALRVVHIKEGSLLDTSSMQLVADLATQSGFQVWIEVVDDKGDADIVIEDGLLVDRSAAEAAE